jgi:hypothetical protein
VGGRKIGLERVEDQEKCREQEHHNVGQSDIGSERVIKMSSTGTHCTGMHTYTHTEHIYNCSMQQL